MTDKQKQYELLYKQLLALAEGESDEVAMMANTAALLHDAFHFWWTGFYRVVGEELVLGPFQGPVACTRIPFGRGVCGTAWKMRQTIIVPDVEQFPGHIACSSASRSEIVVPLFRDDRVVAVLDIDSEHLATFDETDRVGLEKLAGILGDSFQFSVFNSPLSIFNLFVFLSRCSFRGPDGRKAGDRHI